MVMQAALLCSAVMAVVMALCVASASSIAPPPPPLSYVDPFIGTGGYGYGMGALPPGPQVPFGMMRVGPDTASKFRDFASTYQHFGGYFYHDEHIRVFSHTHMVGSGVQDYGNVGVMPSTVPPSSALVQQFGFRQNFTHANETASPGYYSVLLSPSNIMAELTATQHVALHRYTFPTQGSAYNKYIFVDASYTLDAKACSGAQVQVNATSQQITGWVLNKGSLSARFGGYQLYYAITFSAPFTQYGVWTNGTVQNQTSSTSGCNIGSFVGFASSVSQVEMYVGISFISAAQALINLQAEQTTFDNALAAAQKTWSSVLSLVQVEANSDQQDEVIKLYSAVYHSFLAPTLFSEVGGVYKGFDLQIHQLENGTQAYYTDMSIWDTHRTQVAWVALVQPQIQQDVVRSLVLMFQQGGDLPRWPMAYGYTSAMIGTHADILIADAFAKGLDFDINTAYAGMYQGATQSQQYAGRSDIEDWINIGYVAYDVDSKGCSDTLEYAMDDWAISGVATALGKASDAAMFFNRSKNYVNMWNTREKYMCPKTKAGKWECPRLKTDIWDPRYVEGDANHWRWFVPHDPAGLVQLFGTTGYFVQELDNFFNKSFTDHFQYGALPNPYYWAGNEPDIFAAYLFAWAGRIDLTQKWVRTLVDTRFSSKPSGVPGNDDYGTMSSWLIWGMLGMYPQTGSPTGQHILGSPIFPKITIQRPAGNLVVITNNSSSSNIYVQNVQLNGQNLTEPFIQWEQMKNGCTLEFWMGPTPSTWGQVTPPPNAPPSFKATKPRKH